MYNFIAAIKTIQNLDRCSCGSWVLRFYKFVKLVIFRESLKNEHIAA